MWLIQYFCFIIIISLITLGNAQSGVYIRDFSDESLKDKTKWTLTLHQDGTFLYHFFRDLEGALNPEENFYGKGTWVIHKKIISFSSSPETEIDRLNTINFTSSKARYIIKSPRDKSNEIVKTSIRFYESNVNFIKGLQLFKQ